MYEQSNRIVQAYLDSLNDHERGVLEQKALQASSIGGHMSKSVRESVIWNHTFSLIEKIQGGGQQEMKIG